MQYVELPAASEEGLAVVEACPVHGTELEAFKPPLPAARAEETLAAAIYSERRETQR